jgi:hypothetical protein
VPGQGRYCIQAYVEGHSVHDFTVDVPKAPSRTVELVFPSTCLSGLVIDESSGLPVTGATVRANETWPWARLSGGTATTSSSGQFHIDLEPGDYSIEAWLPKGGVAREAVVIETQGLDDLVLSLSPGHDLQGRVIDKKRRGLAGVEVRQHPSHSRRNGWAQTGANGRFRIAGLLNEPHVLTATLKKSYAVHVGVVPGGDDIVLRLDEPGHLRVLVRDPEGYPVKGAEVRLVRIDGLDAPPLSDGQSDDKGFADLDVPAGTLGLSVAAEVEPGLRQEIGQAVVKVRAGERTTAEIRLRRPLPVPP